MTADDVLAYRKGFLKIPGWFTLTDLLVFDAVTDQINSGSEPGNFLELGVLAGKSGAFLSRKVRPNNRVYLCDLFDLEANEVSNRFEVRASYGTVSYARAEANLKEFGNIERASLLVTHSSQVGQVVSDRNISLIHVDASHIHPYIGQDLDLALRELLSDDGWLVVDDYRTFHATAVAEAFWNRVGDGRLFPVVLTETKAYCRRPESNDAATRLEFKSRMESLGLTVQEVSAQCGTIWRVEAPLVKQPYRRPRRFQSRVFVRNPLERFILSMAGRAKRTMSQSNTGNFPTLLRRDG